jgi:hypothetical protein
MAEVTGIVRAILKDIVVGRRDVMMLATRQRAKFEGWLKFELAAALSSLDGIHRVVLEDRYITGGRADLSFEVRGTTWYVEMKTANVNWRADGVESKTRPVTMNVSKIIDDIAKLREKCPPSKGLAVFAFFPVPTRIWGSERDKLLYHLYRIERESGLVENALIRNSDFVVLDEHFGIALFVVEVF